MKTKREMKIGIGIAVILVTAIFVFIGWRFAWGKNERSEARLGLPSAEGNLGGTRRLLDGVLVEPGKENAPIVGVMIENMIEAQPLSGIADAALVFEALAEANITRFLAYFVISGGPSSELAEDRPPQIKIGPVRSARPYYLDLAAEFNTLYGHVGSSPAAYELLHKKGVEGVTDLDQWYNSEYFERVKDRYAPHNVYTSVEKLGEAYSHFQKPGDFSPWQFKNDAPPDLRGDIADIKVGYVAPYNVQWLYDKFENYYKRLQWDGQEGAHFDANGKPIIAKNIAVAFMEMKVLDEIGRKEFKTIGEGEGMVFQDGRVVPGTWKKLSAKDRLHFYDLQGTAIAFNAGTTWVEIVPTGYEVKY